MSADAYTYCVAWSPEDKEYVGLCAELSSLSWLEPSRETALAGIRKVAAEAIADMCASGETLLAS